jgi:hypothetical protein
MRKKWSIEPRGFAGTLATKTGVILRVSAIGAVMLGVAGAFAHAGSWLSPARLPPILAARFDSLRLAPRPAHWLRISALRNLPRTFWRRAFPRPFPTRRCVQEHGLVAVIDRRCEVFPRVSAKFDADGRAQCGLFNTQC